MSGPYGLHFVCNSTFIIAKVSCYCNQSANSGVDR